MTTSEIGSLVAAWVDPSVLLAAGDSALGSPIETLIALVVAVAGFSSSLGIGGVTRWRLNQQARTIEGLTAAHDEANKAHRAAISEVTTASREDIEGLKREISEWQRNDFTPVRDLARDNSTKIKGIDRPRSRSHEKSHGV